MRSTWHKPSKRSTAGSANASQQYVCVRDVHGVMRSQKDEKLRQIHNQAGLVTPDGMPLVWLSRWKGFPWVERVCGADLTLAVCRQSLGQGIPSLFLRRRGRCPREARQPAHTMVFRDCKSQGVYSPPYRPLTKEEDERVIRTINDTKPDIVWVGLSTPKQEYWMYEHLGRISAPVMVGVGAAFDFHAGLKKRAPRCMQRSGLEWCFRSD